MSPIKPILGSFPRFSSSHSWQLSSVITATDSNLSWNLSFVKFVELVGQLNARGAQSILNLARDSKENNLQT